MLLFSQLFGLELERSTLDRRQWLALWHGMARARWSSSRPMQLRLIMILFVREAGGKMNRELESEFHCVKRAEWLQGGVDVNGPDERWPEPRQLEGRSQGLTLPTMTELPRRIAADRLTLLERETAARWPLVLDKVWRARGLIALTSQEQPARATCARVSKSH